MNSSRLAATSGANRPTSIEPAQHLVMRAAVGVAHQRGVDPRFLEPAPQRGEGDRPLGDVA